MNKRQVLFIEEYIKDRNGAQAAIRAGYSPRSARVTASKMLAQPHVRRAVEEKVAEAAERAGVEAVEVIRELAAIAFSDMGTYLTIDEDGVARLDWSKLPKGATKVIAGVEEETTTDKDGNTVTKLKFKLIDKLGALDKLARHLGMYNDNVQLSGSVGLTHEQWLEKLKPKA